MTTWRDRLLDIDNEWEIEEFCANCKLEAGLNFRDDWVELLIAVGRKTVSFQAKDVEVLEGRDYDSSSTGALAQEFG